MKLNTPENIAKILGIREALVSHNLQIDKYGKLSAIIKEFNEFMFSAGFPDFQDFLIFNYTVALHEIDDCYRIDVVEPFLEGCDNCNGRGAPCYVICSDNDYLLMLFPRDESDLVASQQQWYINRGIDFSTKVLVHPKDFLYWQHNETHAPNRCSGRFVQVQVPRFDVTWRTDFFARAGLKCEAARDKINGA